ncbi:hypothetical protein KIMH_01110 [Bombiscardovia apis]|uniref:RCC1-like domain-containing protein n=1 Tax=Bombiscardovia apis TaxID=2932182 RepID=A0ABM8BB16_9BIFI|nr:hypothetical protein [Bombiscardovia apis]BDR54000.1 hypothetical protein KIMH_01110 [Bombiscardovia apis]
MAFDTDGTLWAWGENTFGNLGNGTFTNSANLPTRVRIPDGITFTSVSVGSWFNLAIDSNGNLWSWGYNKSGVLGDGTTVNKNIPVRVQAPAGVRFKSISGGQEHALAVDINGTLWAWGNNRYGQFGNGTANGGSNDEYPSATTPIKIPTGVKFTTVSAGFQYSMALDDSGNAYGWGWNGEDYDVGYLGTANTSSDKVLTPQLVLGGIHFKTITAGGWFSFLTAGISKDNGNTYTWGHNYAGALGNGTTNSSIRPEKITTPVPFTDIQVGSTHMLALGTDNQAYAWGENSSTSINNPTIGLVGNGTNVDQHTPVAVDHPANVPADYQVASISAGIIISAYIGSDGRIYASGPNAYGQLGDGTTINRLSPVRIANPKIAITAISFDTTNAKGFTHDTVIGIWHVKAPAHPVGKVKIRIRWTLSGASQTVAILDYEYKISYTVHFDLGAATSHATPIRDQSIVSGETAAWPDPNPAWPGHRFAGWFQGTVPWDFGTDPVNATMTLTALWDDISFTLKPQAGPVNKNNPVTITANPQQLKTRFTQVSTGITHTLAIGSDGNTYAWGYNGYGQFGNGTTTDRNIPTLITPPAGVRFNRVFAGMNASFAFDTTGRLWAWGNNQYGQLGNGSSITTAPFAKTTPVQVHVPAGVTFTHIYPSYDFTLAVTNTNTVYTWGQNDSGQLGNADNTLAPQFEPVPVNLNGETVKQAAAGTHHAMILTNSNKLYTWGYNATGQLGNGTTTNQVTPRVVTPPASGPFTSIGAGYQSSYALDSSQHLYSWGGNPSGELGLGDTSNRTTPTRIPSLASRSITKLYTSTSSYSAFATDSTGNTWAWGHNQYGQLGTGSPTPASSNNGGIPTPTNITNNLPANTTRIYTSAWHTITLDNTKNLWLWGDNQWGELGNDTIPTGVGNTNAHSYTPLHPTPLPITVTGLHFGSEAGENLTYDATNHSWKANTPRHTPDEKVEVKIHWTIDGTTQPDYSVPNGFTYYSLFTLPKAGAIPLHRLAGSAILLLTALAATTYAAHELSKRRKRIRGSHTHRLSQSQTIS